MRVPIPIKEVHDFLCKFAPLSLAEEWDNVGLQLGSFKKNVTGILVALDVTEAVLEEAVQLKANLLITHHPLFFKSLKKLDDSNVTSRLAKFAIENKINILSFHTNLDSTKEGLNDLLANRLELKKIKPLILSQNSKDKKVGMGRIGEHAPLLLKNLAEKIQKKLCLSSVRLVGDPRKAIRQVALVTGSGSGYFLEAKKRGADVLITGDVKYHTALDALSEQICLIDIGHFGSEIGMVHLIAEKLKKWAKNKRCSLQIFETKAQQDPFIAFS